VTSVLSKVIQVSEFVLLSCGKQRLVNEEFIFLLWEVQPRNSCLFSGKYSLVTEEFLFLFSRKYRLLSKEFLLSCGKYRHVTDEFGSCLIVRRCSVQDLVL